ncbi:MAG: hypothetical protein N2319_05685 [Candidatus Kapabacteria bacterium]|nr:hypothetical protein [Candidatus Kapabacteria bacterium]
MGNEKSFLIVPIIRTDNPVCAIKDVLHLKGVGHLKKYIVPLNAVKSLYNSITYIIWILRPRL